MAKLNSKKQIWFVAATTAIIDFIAAFFLLSTIFGDSSKGKAQRSKRKVKK